MQHNNPYLAAKQFKDKTASVASDAYYYKANNYANSVWANTFGGLNIYDGENSGVFGISFGYDREVSEGVLLGVYGTYANSELKDKVTKNEADNFQFGVYSNIKFAQTWESNFKVYGQVAKVDTTSTTNVGTTQGDFAQRFFGASGNVGKVFNPADGFYIKPFVGANYYYGYTPNYTETGVLAKHVRSTSNDTLSLEIGGEFRKYFNESAYIFATPKIEQFVIARGDGYYATYAGATQGFFIESDEKKKTYGQLLVGGNIELNDALSINAGIGAKQILSGKVEDKNETYLSGNLGLKYKF